MSNRKNVFFVLFFCIIIINVFGQKNENNVSDNWFLRNFNQRIYFGYYGSYYDDNINVLQSGYDAVLKLINLSPNFNLLDFSIGLNVLMAFDQVNEAKKDNFGNMRPNYSRITPGFEFNWCARLFVIPIPKIDARIFLEGLGITLVVYTREFPNIGNATGTVVNIGSHVGAGMEYRINENLKGYTSVRLFHASNGKKYEENPALDAVGIIMGLQF